MRDDDFIAGLKQELQALQEALVRTPIYAKIRALEEVIALYEGEHTNPDRHDVTRTSATTGFLLQVDAEGRRVPKRTMIQQAVKDYLNLRGGIARRRDILGHLLELGLLRGKHPVQVLAPILSETPGLQSDGKGSWRIVGREPELNIRAPSQ